MFYLIWMIYENISYQWWYLSMMTQCYTIFVLFLYVIVVPSFAKCIYHNKTAASENEWTKIDSFDWHDFTWGAVINFAHKFLLYLENYKCSTEIKYTLTDKSVLMSKRNFITQHVFLFQLKDNLKSR